VIEAKGLRKVYRRNTAEVEALRGVDLHVTKGEFLAVLGPSGCGKSTLLHLLGGISRPTEGTVSVEGSDLATLSDAELADVRRHKVGFVFQAFNLVPVLTAEQNVALPATIAGVAKSRYRDRVKLVLDQVGLSDRATHLPSELSGGEQQRVAIARALVLQPAVILADEPTGNLDSHTGAEIMTLLKRLHDEGQTIVLVTHDARMASLADRVAFMRDGRIVREQVITAGGDAAALVSRLVELEV
jgi:putative ABC transport system ATP-binding protein